METVTKGCLVSQFSVDFMWLTANTPLSNDAEEEIAHIVSVLSTTQSLKTLNGSLLPFAQKKLTVNIVCK